MEHKSFFNGTSADADVQRVVDKAKALYPQYFQLLELESKMDQLQWQRARLSGSKYHGTNAYVLKVVETNQLRCLILDFENAQGKRVETILQQHEQALESVALARQAKNADTVKKGMPIKEEDNFMRWELDTDVGDVNEVKDELDHAIEKAEAEAEELSSRFTYEALLHNTLAEDMKNFVCIAKLSKHEASLWVPKNSDKAEFHVFRAIEKHELQKLKDEGLGYMAAAALRFAQFEQNGAGDSYSDHDKVHIVAIDGDWDLEQSHDKAIVPDTLKTVDNPASYDEAPGVGHAHINWTPNTFCNFCKKYGHVESYCPDKYPEEDQPLYCDVCNKEGHWEETCWVLHPELRDEYVQQQKAKMKKMTCHHCGGVGHVRRWCHRLHR